MATLALPADIPEACIPIKGKGCMNVFTLSPGTLSFPTAKVNRQSSLASRSSSSTAREEDISQLLLSPSYSIWHKVISPFSSSQFAVKIHAAIFFVGYPRRYGRMAIRSIFSKFSCYWRLLLLCTTNFLHLIFLGKRCYRIPMVQLQYF